MRFFNEPTVFFTTKFNNEFAMKFINELREIEANDNHSGAVVIINSRGGEVDALKMMLDFIHHTHLHITTVVSGMAASCGCLLAMAGDTRLAFRDAVIMSHQYSGGVGGKYIDLKSGRDYQDELHKFMVDHYKIHTGLSEKVIKEKLLPAEDVFLSAEQAKQFNIIDEVIMATPKPIGVKAKQRFDLEQDKEHLNKARQLVKKLEGKQNAGKKINVITGEKGDDLSGLVLNSSSFDGSSNP